MVKEIEELIKIVGKGNLLETLFIYFGSFQHADLGHSMNSRNHFDLSAFIKKEREPLDEYFNLKFSLQGLFLIYAQAYNVLIENAQLNTQEVIDKIYAAVGNKRTPTNYSALEKLREEVIDQAELTEDQKKLKLLNVLANPKRDPIFKTEEDFESKVLTHVKKLLNEESDQEFYFNKLVIDCYYSIHQDIKVDRDVALLFSLLCSLGGSYKKSLSPDKITKREVLEICENQLIECYIISLASKLHMIGLSSRDGTIKYTINHENVDRQEEGWKEIFKFGLYSINISSTLEQLLKKQNSDEFEQLVTSPDNIYYSVLPEENEYKPNFIVSKKKEKDHKNTVCKLILGVFVLSVGLYAADYFLMKQKLFNSITNILPQTNLIIAAVLTIVVVYALFQLLKSPQEPPLSTVDDVQNKKLEPLHAKQA